MTEKELLITALTYFLQNDNENSIVTRIFPMYQDLGGDQILVSVLLRYDAIFDATEPKRPDGPYVFRITPNQLSLVADQGAKNFIETHWQKLSQESDRLKKQDQLLDLTLDDLVDKIIDKPKLKRRLRHTEYTAAISALAAIISAIAAIAVLKGC
jgi:hypothetical protein